MIERRWTLKLTEQRRPFVFMVGLAYVWHIVLFVLGNRLTPGLTVFYAWLPLCLTPFWVLWVTRHLIDETINEHNDYDGRFFAACREISGHLIIIVLHVLMFTLFVATGAVFVFHKTLGTAGLVELLPIPSVQWFLGFFVRFYVVGLVGVLLLGAIAHLAFLFQYLVNRYGALLSLWVGAIVVWVGLRTVPLLAGMLSWLPAVRFEELYVVGGVYEFRGVLVETAPFVGIILFGIFVTGAGAYMMSTVPLKRDATDGTPMGEEVS